MTVHLDEMLTGEFFVDVRITELEGGIGQSHSIYRHTEHVSPRDFCPDDAASGAVLAAFETLRKVWSDRPF